jgi:putative ABC transport system ATP-binding protein
VVQKTYIMPQLLEVEHLTKIYHLGDVQVNALRGINVQIDTSEFVAVMGPSGSGKSTFMSILGCLDQPSMGFIDSMELMFHNYLGTN